ncbi:MAG: hypothetical protein JXX29_14260 [Deltaproteobacteria bacterium]|nr:hypothetical protein [Deltaproteobacteria bacterium]MBN2672842.1 hypothetical protein [Deltaproteobacteria bacterium]
MNENPYHPPSEIDVQASAQFAIEQVTLTPLVKAAAFTTAALGLLCLFAGIQLFVVVRVYGPLAFVPYVFLGFFPVGAIIGKWLFQMGARGAWAGLIYGGLAAVSTAGWIYYSLSHGLLLPLHAFVPLHGIAVTVLCGLSIAPTKQADAARAHFAKEDLNIRF